MGVCDPEQPVFVEFTEGGSRRGRVGHGSSGGAITLCPVSGGQNRRSCENVRAFDCNLLCETVQGVRNTVLTTRVPLHGSLEMTPSEVGGSLVGSRRTYVPSSAIEVLLTPSCLLTGSGECIISRVQAILSSSSVIIRDIEDVCNAGFASIAHFYFDFKDTGKQDSHVVDECLNTSGMPSPREEVLQLAEGLVDLKLSGLHSCIPRSTSVMLLSHWQPTASLFTMEVDRMQTPRTILALLFTWIQGCGDGDRRKGTWSLEHSQPRLTERQVVTIPSSCPLKILRRFGWVFCQLEILRHCFPSSVLNILEELHESLDKTYEQLLREINQANREHAYLLQSLTVAVHQLGVEERAEVLAVDFNADWRWEDNEGAVLSICSNLVTVVMDGHSRVALFFRSSMESFMEK
ncbi:hypothetical protein EDB92DRAFT_2000915 [Lactarius akahatsu]|uniref:Uncharacterized protein n=1 Tax=Lactarius akahatsu TaxID=416441 RepID=A0AAD4LG72_9AGAM|nr:hypothetical protein EDB92DRAFT_2000915 [Lactarius akahatsu]